MAPAIHCACDRLAPTGSLRPNPKNPNRHPKEQIALLAKLISWHGWRVPITVSKQSNFVVRGHARLEAAKLLKLAEVPVDFQEYESEGVEFADLLADNKIAELSSLNATALQELVAAMPEDRRERTGIKAADMSDLLAKGGMIDPAKCGKVLDHEPGECDGLMGTVFVATEEQAITINAAVEKYLENGHEDTPGAILASICAEFGS